MWFACVAVAELRLQRMLMVSGYLAFTSDRNSAVSSLVSTQSAQAASFPGSLATSWAASAQSCFSLLSTSSSSVSDMSYCMILVLWGF